MTTIIGRDTGDECECYGCATPYYARHVIAKKSSYTSVMKIDGGKLGILSGDLVKITLNGSPGTEPFILDGVAV